MIAAATIISHLAAAVGHHNRVISHHYWPREATDARGVEQVNFKRGREEKILKGVHNFILFLFF